MATTHRLFQRMVIRRIRSYGQAVLLDVIAAMAAYVLAGVLRYLDAGDPAAQMMRLLVPALCAGGIYAIASYLLGLHRRLWRFVSLYDGFALIEAAALATGITAVLHIFGVGPLAQLPPSVIAVGAFLLFIAVGGVKVIPQALKASRIGPPQRQALNVLIVGAGQAGATLASRFPANSAHGYQVVAFVDDNPAKWRQRIMDKPILGPIDIIPNLVPKLAVDLIAIAMPSTSPQRIGEIIALCQQTHASIKILPGLYEMINRQTLPFYLREINVADLLGRAVVPLPAPEARTQLAGKTILVTGAAGSIGSELCRQLLAYAPAGIIALDTNETGLFDLAAGLADQPHADQLRVRIGDITNAADMQRLFSETAPHVIFHAAAYKHVPLLEEHPNQAIRTNILGTYGLCQLARAHDVGTFVFVSSDKAAAPINVLGASKRLGERIIAAMAEENTSGTRFCAVRFGNVIGSRGSVVPTFTQQIERGGPVTVTHPDVTRYFMTISEACGLVILTSTLADSGGLYLLDMGQPVRIADLAAKMIRLRGLRIGEDIAITYTHLRPGEKLHEALTAPDETLEPTSHAKILRFAGHAAPDADELARTLDALRHALADNPAIMRAWLLTAAHLPDAMPVVQ